MTGFFSFRPWVFSWKEMPKLRFGLLLSFDRSRTSTGDGCLFLLEPQASDLQPIGVGWFRLGRLLVAAKVRRDALRRVFGPHAGPFPSLRCQSSSVCIFSGYIWPFQMVMKNNSASIPQQGRTVWPFS